MDVYTLGAVKHDATVIKGVQDSSISPGLAMLVAAGGGGVDPAFSGVGQCEVRASFTSSALKTILVLTGIAPLAMASDKLYFSKMLADGLRADAGSHFEVTMANGILLPMSINAGQGGQASIACQMIPRSSDGLASPIAIVVNASLPANGELVDELYTLGEVSINGTELEGADSVTIDLGMELEVSYGSGHVYPTVVSVIRRTPSVIVSTLDIATFETWSEIGVAQGETDSTIAFQDQTRGGVRGSSPITFAVDQGHIGFETVGAGQGAKGVGQVRITPTYDGTNDIFVLSGLT